MLALFGVTMAWLVVDYMEYKTKKESSNKDSFFCFARFTGCVMERLFIFYRRYEYVKKF